MYSRWYLSVFVIALFAFGTVSSSTQEVVPNQEIVFQFTSRIVSQDQANLAIETVKAQLEEIGVDCIQVNKADSGEVKITYFSHNDVNSIKQILSDNETLTLEDSETQIPEFPSSSKTVSYNLDVNEIHASHDFSFEKSGKVAVEFKSAYNRLFTANECVFPNLIDFSAVNLQVLVAYKYYQTVAFGIDNLYRTIPEVRAGPSFKMFV